MQSRAAVDDGHAVLFFLTIGKFSEHYIRNFPERRREKIRAGGEELFAVAHTEQETARFHTRGAAGVDVGFGVAAHHGVPGGDAGLFHTADYALGVGFAVREVLGAENSGKAVGNVEKVEHFPRYGQGFVREDRAQIAAREEQVERFGDAVVEARCVDAVVEVRVYVDLQDLVGRG